MTDEMGALFTDRLHLMAVLLVPVLALAPAGCAGEEGSQPQSGDGEGWAELREEMVETLRDVYGMEDERVLAAMATVPRHTFIPAGFLGVAPPYGDHPCPIGFGQTISQPFIVAYMTSRMEIEPGERILEIGTGSGYQAAILAELGADVYTIEIIPELAAHAEVALAAAGYDSVHVLAGDGYQGWPEHAPFDVIIVTCAPEEIPEALVEQLADQGRMILPVGEYYQRLVVCRREGTTVYVEDDIPVRFVPMVHDDDGALEED